MQSIEPALFSGALAVRPLSRYRQPIFVAYAGAHPDQARIFLRSSELAHCL